MARWLFKEEPDHYAYADLEREGSTVWEGVSNPLARKYLRSVSTGDQVFYYHTGKERAVVGIARVIGGPEPAPTPDDPKAVVVTVAPVKRLAKVVTLAAIKSDKLLAGWDLARLPRLSVVPVTDEQWHRVEELSRL